MRKTKHTPGPWTFSGQKGTVGACIAAQVWDCEGHHLSAMKSTENPEEATANARLVAAAPDMLEALKYLVSVWDEVTGGNWRESPDHVDRKVLAAIKKAIGE